MTITNRSDPKAFRHIWRTDDLPAQQGQPLRDELVSLDRVAILIDADPPPSPELLQEIQVLMNREIERAMRLDLADTEPRTIYVDGAGNIGTKPLRRPCGCQVVCLHRQVP